MSTWDKLNVTACITMLVTFLGSWYVVWPVIHNALGGSGVGVWLITFVVTCFISGFLAKLSVGVMAVILLAAIYAYERWLLRYYYKTMVWWRKVKNPDDYIELRQVAGGNYMLAINSLLHGTIAENKLTFARMAYGDLIHSKGRDLDVYNAYILKSDAEHFQPLLEELKEKERLSYGY